MRYMATILFPHGRMSNVFLTVGDAEQWLDSQNNNAEYTTIIDELDENGKVVDGFFYTRAAE